MLINFLVDNNLKILFSICQFMGQYDEIYIFIIYKWSLSLK